MKIAIISRNWFTETKRGAERYIYELAKGLIDRGHEIITVSKQHSDLPNEHMKVCVRRGDGYEGRLHG